MEIFRLVLNRQIYYFHYETQACVWNSPLNEKLTDIHIALPSHYQFASS